MKLSCMTPDGQITIPRSVMKALGIGGGNDIVIEVENGKLILKKVEISGNENDNNHICLAG